MNPFHVIFLDNRKNIENIILPFSVILFASNIFPNHYLSLYIMQFYLNKIKDEKRYMKYVYIVKPILLQFNMIRQQIYMTFCQNQMNENFFIPIYY